MIYQITSGRGPAECELAVAKFFQFIESHYEVDCLISTTPGYHKGTYKSIQFEMKVEFDDLSCGPVLWICESPYREGHDNRKNWYIEFSKCDREGLQTINLSQIEFENIRSRGNGGQNVNKVETAVRATNKLTGDVVVCMEERTQYLNKQRAIRMLTEMVAKRNTEIHLQNQTGDWKKHTRIQRGNPVMTFEGPKFRRRA